MECPDLSAKKQFKKENPLRRGGSTQYRDIVQLRTNVHGTVYMGNLFATSKGNEHITVHKNCPYVLLLSRWLFIIYMQG